MFRVLVKIRYIVRMTMKRDHATWFVLSLFSCVRRRKISGGEFQGGEILFSSALPYKAKRVRQFYSSGCAIMDLCWSRSICNPNGPLFPPKWGEEGHRFRGYPWFRQSIFSHSRIDLSLDAILLLPCYDAMGTSSNMYCFVQMAIWLFGTFGITPGPAVKLHGLQKYMRELARR